MRLSSSAETKTGLVIVGCGGTTYHMIRMLRDWLRTTEIGHILILDPDRTEKGQHRQWPVAAPETTKAGLVASELRGCSAGISAKCECFSGVTVSEWLDKHGLGQVWVVVNVDNDQARCEVLDWARTAAEDDRAVAVLLTGCERLHGQAYEALFDERIQHDPRVYHPELLEPTPATPPCGTEQVGMSNAWTAMVGMMMLYKWTRGKPSWPDPTGEDGAAAVEVYWETESTVHEEGDWMWPPEMWAEGIVLTSELEPELSKGGES